MPGTESTQGLADLPVPPGGHARMFSSYDRNGGNEDTGNFLRIEPDGTRVLAEATGPGCLTRIWSANPDVPLRIELDGAVAFDAPFAALFDGTKPPFVAPLAGPTGGGFLCHVPVPFTRSLRITTPPGGAFYYQITVATGATPDPTSLLAGARPEADGETVSANGVAVPQVRSLLHRDGPGELLALHVEAGGDPSMLWLEIRFDGEREPAVAAPLADLFAALPQQIGDAHTLRLPMPFHRAFDLAVVGRAPATAQHVAVTATFRALPADHSRRYLHARFHHAVTVWGEPVRVLDTAGPGHFVGLSARLRGGEGHGLSFLEGDETITVDGDVAFRGTGTEDLFSGAWYFRGGPFTAPFVAVSQLDADDERVACARFFVADPIPFARTLRFDLEHGGQNDTPGSDYRTVAFWYADTPTGEAPEAEVATPQPRLPTTRPARDVWPDFTTKTDNPAHPLRTVVPAGEYPLPGPDVITWFGGGRAVFGPLALPKAGANLVVVPLAVAVDTVRTEPILAAIRAFRVCGPFPGGQRRGIEHGFGPERNSDPDQRYDDITGPGDRGWRDLPNPPWPNGYVDLNPLFTPDDEIVAYAATEIDSPREQQAVLWIGSDDAVQVFLNGERIHEHRGLRGAARDQDRIAITLRQGANRLLIKVEDYFGGFGLFARIDGAAGLSFRAR